MPPGEDPDSLIRSQGGPAFLQRISEAKDFFSFQLDRLTRSPEFQTPKGKANVAHRLAGWVSFIKDAAFREAVMGNIVLRLEISMREFSKLLGQVRAPQKNADDPIPQNVATPLTDPAFRLLALAALHDAAACEWLRNAPYRELLARETDAGMVLQILESSFVPGDRGAQQTFLSSLPASDEATISELLSEPPPAHALQQAGDCWNALVRRQIQRHLESLQARLRTPGLPLEETLKLQKEVFDYTARLLEIARPLSPPLE
jgi:DNA primase